MYGFNSHLRHNNSNYMSNISVLKKYKENGLPKVLVICGPTSSGKSDLAVEIAKEQNGEVISSDSRQVYRGMDIGSGKITKKEMRNVPHHLLDVASPKRKYTVAQFKKASLEVIKGLHKNNKLPIICGGTGFYIDSLIYDLQIPEVKEDVKLRKELNKKPIEELQKELKKLDKRRYSEIDIQNKVRLIRAIEIAREIGKVPILAENKLRDDWDIEIIMIDQTDKVLKERIHIRLVNRLKKGMVTEVKKLRESGVSWRRLESFGLEYRFISQYIQKTISKEEMGYWIETKSWQYAKRQRMWFRRYVNQL